MKKIKNFVLCNMILVAFVLGISSAEAKTYATYKKGDVITVNVNASDKADFYVIKDSSSEEQNVTAPFKK